MLLGEVILKKRRENILHLLLGPIWNKKKISALYLEETKKDAKNFALRHLLTVKKSKFGKLILFNLIQKFGFDSGRLSAMQLNAWIRIRLKSTQPGGQIYLRDPYKEPQNHHWLVTSRVEWFSTLLLFSKSYTFLLIRYIFRLIQKNLQISPRPLQSFHF